MESAEKEVERVKMPGGKFMLEWSDGRCREIGSVDIDIDKLGAECKLKFRRIRLGWEFVRIGMRIWIRGFGNERDRTDPAES